MSAPGGLAGAAAGLARALGPIGTFGLVVIIIAAMVAVLAPLITPYDPFSQHLLQRNRGPSADYLLGVDHMGRDVLSRLILGTRISLTVGITATVVALALGALVGLGAMATGRWLEYPIFAVIDLIRAVPGILLALILIVALGQGMGSVILALGLSYAPIFARVARATWLRESTSGYAEMARLIGASEMGVLFRHVLPNVLGALITQTVIVLPRIIVTESVLSFLGLGVAPATPTWGRMISGAIIHLETAPHAILVPVLTLSIVTFALSMMGDRIRLRVDPTRRSMSR